MSIDTAATPAPFFHGTEAERTRLLPIAEKLCWWDAPAVALRNRTRFLAQVMTLGNWEDVRTVREVFGIEALRDVLSEPPAGVFDDASWIYWHHFLRIDPVPPLPRRRL